MPLTKLQFRPGVNRENTNYSGEGGWFDGDKIRFRSGYPEKIGGWQNLATFVDGVANTYKGVCRGLWNWITLNNSNLLSVGTEQKLYVENGGMFYDITPIRQTGIINTNPFATASGSKLITVTDTNHGATVGTYVTFSGSTGDIGGVPAAEFNTEFEIVIVINANSYNIIVPTVATSSASGGGASVTAAYQANSGNSAASSGTGWGAGPWGRDGWGEEYITLAEDNTQLRLWPMDNYGQDLVAAIREGPIYYWVADTTTNPPRAVTLESLATAASFDGTFVPNKTYEAHTSGVNRFTFAIGSNPYDPLDSETAFDPMLVRWSDQDNIYQWVPAADNQSGELRLSNGSQLVTSRHNRQELVVWTDSSVFALQYVGPPFVWGANLLMDNTSIASPNAAVGASNVLFWMGVDKFYMYDGRVQTLPCSIRQFVFNDFNAEQALQVTSGGNDQFSEVWWHYPSANSTVNDKYVIYNYLDNVWYYGSLNRTAWLDSALRSNPMGAFSIKVSYLSAAISSSDTTINLLDAITYPSAGTIQIDDEQITYTSRTSTALSGCTRGVNTTTAASHVAYSTAGLVIPNQIMYHEVGNDDLSTPDPVAIEAYISSSDFDIGDGHNFGFVWRIIPDLTFDGSTTPAPNYPEVTMVCKPRQFSGSAYGSPDAQAVTSEQNYATQHTYTVQLYTGQVYTRVRGRQMAFEIRSDGIGTAWQLGVPRIDVRPDGRR